MCCDNCGNQVADKDEIFCRKCKPSLQVDFEIKQAKAKINEAYWKFCRCSNAKPPSLVYPEAYFLLSKHNAF